MVLELKDSQDEFPYEWVLTQDQSVTLKSISENSEWMHSLHGAYSESQYIYGEAVRMALNQKKEIQVLKVLSMGLGLGYLELITVFECVKAGVNLDIESFELDDCLKDLFKFQCHLGLIIINSLDLNQIASLEDFSKDPKVLDFLNSFQQKFAEEHKLCLHYNLPLNFYLNHFFIHFLNDYGFKVLATGFDKILNMNSVTINGPLDLNFFLEIESYVSTKNTYHQKKFNVIFFDAFSSNTQIELWSEDFLNQFILLFSDPEYCVFSTYAKVGSLNRSLRAKGFKFIPKKGFAHKRESTLAYLRL